jgi:aspartyl-tRNA(Asn)/glutamyl-tRNA(Gln) amidotransferase subunit A
MDGMGGPNFMSAAEGLQKIREGALAPAELQAACLQQIERFNPHLNAFITVGQVPGNVGKQPAIPGSASRGALAGIPIAVKDLFDTANLRTTEGSRFFKDHVPTTDAAVVAKLKQAGAFIIGKTNTHEIALGVTSVNPHFGPCHNPWDTARISGGSSGGSAVAVAAGMALAAVGTDTGGSIRIPASLCGVVGLKPTYGRVSLRGVLPLSWNLDHAGPLTRTVEDAALMLQVIAGYDPDDPYSVDAPAEDFLLHLEDGTRGWRVALGIGEYVEQADAEVRRAVEVASEVLARTGAEVSAVDCSFLHQAALANGLMTQADAAVYHRQRLLEQPDWFGDDVRRRLEAGRDLPAADYVLARHTQAEIKRRLARFFESFDILLLPTTPNTAPLIEGDDAVAQARRLTRFTAPFNLAGLPAVSIPCGSDGNGLPIGLQMIAGAWREAALLRAARAYEHASGWMGRRPPHTG